MLEDKIKSLIKIIEGTEVNEIEISSTAQLKSIFFTNSVSIPLFVNWTSIRSRTGSLSNSFFFWLQILTYSSFVSPWAMMVYSISIEYPEQRLIVQHF